MAGTVLKLPSRTVMIGISSFLLGCILSTMMVLNIRVVETEPFVALCRRDYFSQQQQDAVLVGRLPISSSSSSSQQPQTQPQQVRSALQGVRILVVLVAYDFSQLPHLEEVLGSYHDVCESGVGQLDIVIHATIAYPVTLIDLLNSRITCAQYTITICIKPKSLRLFLVNEHRQVFYNAIDRYDLFIYSEDDIRVTTTTITTYWQESLYIEQTVGVKQAANYNVGIVRYELNFPPNVIMDDKTRHATQNVTRVYWEHSGFDRPVVGNAVQPIHGIFQDRYLTMQNHHQGMFLATRHLLQEWQVRDNCDFAKARMRPGTASQPTEGTQRVWMSSQMLYGGRHCNVQQVLPKHTFGLLTVLHLPNKNYRRVGKYRQRVFADGTEQFEQPHESLLTALELHLAIRTAWPSKPQYPYRGIHMIDQVLDAPRDRTPVLERRMREYQAYVDRGGVMSVDDMTKTRLVEDT